MTFFLRRLSITMRGREYDTATGQVTETVEDLEINAGVLSRSRTELGGVGENYTLSSTSITE